MAKLDFLGDLKRTHKCGELRPADAGQDVVLMGWVNRRRDHGNLIFLDLRDRSGITQVVLDKDSIRERPRQGRELCAPSTSSPSMARSSCATRNTINPNMPTGEIEVVAARTSPPQRFASRRRSRLREDAIAERRSAPEVSLPRPAPPGDAAQLRAASQGRAWPSATILVAQGFLEIETPIHDALHPEGARDYLVPSRVHPGEFYALPQSPQIFKQILMISGFDRYFQIARCFRDEDLRADRQPEFTQIDLEMTFPHAGDVFAVVEGFLTAAWQAAGIDSTTPFPRMTYDEAMRQYGIDKPDMRLPAMAEVKEAFTPENLADARDRSRIACRRACASRRSANSSRKERDELKPLLNAKSGAKIFEDFKRLEKSFPDAAAKIREIAKPDEGDLLVIVAGSQRSEPANEIKARQQAYAIYGAAGQVRLAIAQKYADRHGCFKKGEFRFLWVTDFPFFEWDENEHRWNAAHHPFTSCHERDMDKLESDPGAVRALAYDIVLNGIELGSGSIRIHRQDIQSIIFKSLGMSPRGAAAALRLFPRSPAVRHSSARWHCAWTRPHRDDPRRRIEPARSHPVPQDGKRHRPHDGRSDFGRRRSTQAAEY